VPRPKSNTNLLLLCSLSLLACILQTGSALHSPLAWHPSTSLLPPPPPVIACALLPVLALTPSSWSLHQRQHPVLFARRLNNALLVSTSARPRPPPLTGSAALSPPFARHLTSSSVSRVHPHSTQTVSATPLPRVLLAATNALLPTPTLTVTALPGPPARLLCSTRPSHLRH